MLGKNFFHKITTSFTAVAILLVYSMVALAVPGDLTGEITVSGTVTVNGQPTVSNSTITSGSTIVTGAGSSAVISLGKVGRVELQENSNMVLSFSPSGIVAIVSSGTARMANGVGIATTVSTRDATVIADSSQANNFQVGLAGTYTYVNVTSGNVTMREGSTDRQVAAGSSATAGEVGQTGCEPCLRPGSAPPLNFAGWGWFALLGLGAAGAAILLGTRESKKRPGGGTTVIVSPVD